MTDNHDTVASRNMMRTRLRNIFNAAICVMTLFIGESAPAQTNPKTNTPAQITPVHDPADIPFRRAPMGPSSRSIVVNLSTNVHLAFDATLTRTHTVWEGESLNLYGPPFTDTATRFICDISGKVILETLPVMPWSLSDRTGGNLSLRFAGIRMGKTMGEKVGFLYDLMVPGQAEVRVCETPHLGGIAGHEMIVRTLEVRPIDKAVQFAAYVGAGELLPSAGVANTAVIRRAQDFLLITVRAFSNPSDGVRRVLPMENRLSARPHTNTRLVFLQSERDGKGPYSAILTNTVLGAQVEVKFEFPKKPLAQAVEIATANCSSEAEALKLAKAFSQDATYGFFGLDKSTQILTPDPAFKAKPASDDSFTVEPFPLPKDIKLMVGGLDVLPNGDVALCTYSGEVWIVEGAAGDPAKGKWRRFARGLNECGGLRVVNGTIYVTQKCELTRLTDTDQDGEADLFECISDNWGYTGNYHSFATGPALDPAGNFYVMVTGHRTIYDVPYMGWCMKITPTDLLLGAPTLPTHYQAEAFCDGLRVPNGFGEFQDEIFMTDNQGHWIAANKLNHLQQGKFYGHPSAKPESISRFDGDKDFTPPAVWFPYAWVKSASGMQEITDDRMGPFKGQLLVGEFQNASVMRVALEKVNGEYQGAVFQWVKGFGSGVNRFAFGPDRKLYVGGLRMGHWTSIGPRSYSLDRVSYTGKVPFEMRDVHAQPDGFVITFTKPVDAATAADVENWDIQQYKYAYDGKHGMPEKDRDEKIPGPPVKLAKATVSEDKLSVRLHTEGCLPLHVIAVRTVDVKGAAGEKLRNDAFHYTLNQIPSR